MHPKIKRKLESYKHFHKMSYECLMAELKSAIRIYPNFGKKSPYTGWVKQDLEKLLIEMISYYQEKFDDS